MGRGGSRIYDAQMEVTIEVAEFQVGIMYIGEIANLSFLFDKRSELIIKLNDNDEKHFVCVHTNQFRTHFKIYQFIPETNL